MPLIYIVVFVERIPERCDHQNITYGCTVHGGACKGGQHRDLESEDICDSSVKSALNRVRF